jgi:phage baseplate assembly protein gpV
MPEISVDHFIALVRSHVIADSIRNPWRRWMPGQARHDRCFWPYQPIALGSQVAIAGKKNTSTIPRI